MRLAAARTPWLAWTSLARDLSGANLADASADRYRRGQIRGTIEQMRIMLLGNTVFAPALSFQAWNSGADLAVILWTAAIIAFSWGLFASWRTMYRTSGSPRDMITFRAQTVVNASLWALGMALFYPIVEGNEKAIVTTIMAGSLALGTVGFSRATQVALIYLGILTISNTIVAFACGVLTGDSTDFLVAFLSTAAGISLFSAVIERGRAQLKAFRDHEQLSEKSEVVELLLKGYEAQATEWLWQTDASGHIISAPAQVIEIIDPFHESSSNTTLLNLISLGASSHSLADVRRLKAAFLGRREFHDIELSVEDPETGNLRWILMKGRPQFEGKRFKGFRGIFADATKMVNADRRIKFLANFDSLTGLYNRNSVKKQLSDLRPGKDIRAAFLIDLDGFKQVNDSYGHAVGDGLLEVVAERLRQFEDANLWCARLGGDEFFALTQAGTDPNEEHIAWVADTLIETLAQPYQVGSFNIQISASVGVSRFPDDSHKGLDLLMMSDLALYEAKRNGRNRAEVFDQSMRDRLEQRATLIERLKCAIREKTIRAHYQSQHRLSDGKFIGFEALARWNDSQLGSVRPDIFIPVAEKTGLIVELGAQLLRQSCVDAVAWAEIMGADAPVVSVNISPVQFARMDMAALVATVLEETGLPAHLLEIEVTEGVLISDKARITAALRAISDLGVSIALDDFGTGYSSLSYLKELPLNRLKIDRSFVNGLEEVAEHPVLETIIQLGHSLGLSVIAEGIETAHQCTVLERMGCDDAQGYLFSRPMPPETAQDYVKTAAPSRRHATP